MHVHNLQCHYRHVRCVHRVIYAYDARPKSSFATLGLTCMRRSGDVRRDGCDRSVGTGKKEDMFLHKYNIDGPILGVLTAADIFQQHARS
jgi:hypothetical protein